MAARMSTSTSPCTMAEARSRLMQARKFVEVAELCFDDDSDESLSQVSAALSVLAGIAASDAACCAVLKRRARGQDHREAQTLVSQTAPNGPAIAKDLGRLLNEKDNAHYGLMLVSRSTAQKMLTQAKRIVALSDEVVKR